jgi:transcriptional regulator with XRE-family HTH domain
VNYPQHRKFYIRQPTRGHPAVLRLYEIMGVQQCSIQMLADRAGYGRSTIQNWRTGKKTPTVASLSDCLDVLGYELIIQRRRGDRRA